MVYELVVEKHSFFIMAIDNIILGINVLTK